MSQQAGDMGARMTRVTQRAVERAMRLRERIIELARTPYMMEMTTFAKMKQEWPAYNDQQKAEALPFLMDMQARYGKDKGQNGHP